MVGLASSPASAQTGTWEVGGMSGLSHASLTSGKEFTWSPTATTALFVRRHHKGPYATRVEAAHIRRTGASDVTGTLLTITADFVELPVLFEIQLAPGDRVRPYAMAGPSLVARLDCRQVFTGGGLTLESDCDLASGSFADRFDLGVVGGAGLTAYAGSVGFFLEARAGAGVRPDVVNIDAANSRSVAWSMLAGVSVPLFRIPTRSGPTARAPVTPQPSLPQRPVLVPQRQDASPPAPVAGPVIIAPESPLRQRVTMRLDDVEAREALEAIAALTGMRLVVSPDARKRVSLVLFSTPAEEAVRAIADAAGLTVLLPASAGQAVVVSRKPSPP